MPRLPLDAASCALQAPAADLTLVVPRREVRTVDIIGAADAMVGGFVGAHCRRLSVGQSLLWARRQV